MLSRESARFLHKLLLMAAMVDSRSFAIGPASVSDLHIPK
jgi:hypothetical protein